MRAPRVQSRVDTMNTEWMQGTQQSRQTDTIRRISYIYLAKAVNRPASVTICSIRHSRITLISRHVTTTKLYYARSTLCRCSSFNHWLLFDSLCMESVSVTLIMPYPLVQHSSNNITLSNILPCINGRHSRISIRNKSTMDALIGGKSMPYWTQIQTNTRHVIPLSDRNSAINSHWCIIMQSNLEIDLHIHVYEYTRVGLQPLWHEITQVPAWSHTQLALTVQGK
jgi:hypothetical protein